MEFLLIWRKLVSFLWPLEEACGCGAEDGQDRPFLKRLTYLTPDLHLIEDLIHEFIKVAKFAEDVGSVGQF